MPRPWREPVLTTVPESRAGLPLVIRARDNRLPHLVDWVHERRDDLSAKWTLHGALLFRGFDTASPERFERLVRTLAPDLGHEYLGTSPRDAVTDHVFHASELPPHYPIPQHCEMTFVAQPPRKLFFGCLVAPSRYGETPLSDFRRVWKGLRPDVAERFRARGIRIIRNYAPPGIRGGPFQLKPWPEMFGTTDRDAVTRRAEAEGFEVSWTSAGGLRLVSGHAATRTHPETGEEVWFNHVQVFHVSAAPGEYARIWRLRPTWRHWAVWQLSRALVTAQRRKPSRDLPMHCVYDHDGSEIPEADLEHLRDVIWENMARVPWQRGDVVAIDNFAVSHGRLPYEGPRDIIVAWS